MSSYAPSPVKVIRLVLKATSVSSIGIEMLDTDVAFRTNLITLTGDGAYEDMIITDHSAGDISTEEADQLMKAVQGRFGDEKIKFYTGVSYRHCMIVKDGETSYDLTPPHDVLTRRVGDYLPKGEGALSLIHISEPTRLGMIS